MNSVPWLLSLLLDGLLFTGRPRRLSFWSIPGVTLHRCPSRQKRKRGGPCGPSRSSDSPHPKGPGGHRNLTGSGQESPEAAHLEIDLISGTGSTAVRQYWQHRLPGRDPPRSRCNTMVRLILNGKAVPLVQLNSNIDRAGKPGRGSL